MSLFEFATKHLCEKSEAQLYLGPLFKDLAKVWHSAFSEYQTAPPKLRARLGKVSTATPFVLSALAQTYARDIFSDRDDAGIELCDAIPQVVLVTIGPCILRFNSLNRDGTVGNLDKSQLRKQYFNQNPIKGIDNSKTRLTVGCKFDEAKTQIASVLISLQVGETLVYKFRIDDQDINQLPGAQTPPTSPLTEQIKSKYKAR